MLKPDKNCALVVGASGGIGSALVTALLSEGKVNHVLAASGSDMAAESTISSSDVTWLPYHYNE